MNYEDIGSALGCEEILDELPLVVGDFLLELEDDFNSTISKNNLELQNLKKQFEKIQDQHQKTTKEKQKLKQAALAIEKQADNDSSYFIYSEKELQDELDYQKKVISYAKRKIMLYELLTRIEWSKDRCKGRILPDEREFDLGDLEVFEQINTLWEML
jgi:hypothetical protein